jgi:putative transposon-encoded protein
VDRNTIEAHAIITGTVKTTGNGAHVLVPKDWRGANVKIVRAERFLRRNTA